MAWILVDNGLVIFDWFVLTMRMEVNLDSLLRPSGFSPYMGWEERRVQRLGERAEGIAGELDASAKRTT